MIMGHISPVIRMFFGTLMVLVTTYAPWSKYTTSEAVALSKIAWMAAVSSVTYEQVRIK